MRQSYENFNFNSEPSEANEYLKAPEIFDFDRYIQKELPNAVRLTIPQQKEALENIQKIEAEILKMKVQDVLSGYGLEAEFLKDLETCIDANGYKYLSLPMQGDQTTSIPKLPQDYAIAGGAARLELLKSLGVKIQTSPRDLDVVYIGTGMAAAISHEIAARYMPEDLSRGHGVRQNKSMEEYFTTRDFVLNEVICKDGKIYFTPNALLDNYRNIIRLSDYEWHNSQDNPDGLPKQKLLAKALYLVAVGIEKYGRVEVEPALAEQYEEAFISVFHCSVHLCKAVELGEAVAQTYIEELKKRNQLPQEIHNVADAVRYFSEQMQQKGMRYRKAPKSQFDWEKNIVKNSKDIESKYQDLEEMVDGENPKNYKIK